MAKLCGVQVWLFVALIQLVLFPKETLQSSPGFIFESDEYIYKVVYEQDDIRTFYEAEEFCGEFENGHLASINSPAENEWLHRKIQSIGHLKRTAGRFWVGAYDVREFGKFEWLDGKPFAFHAAHYMSARNPGNKQEYEMCLSLTSSEKDVIWKEDDCYNARGYICKTEGVPKRLISNRRFGYEFEDDIWTYRFIIRQDDMLSWPEADLYCRKTEWGQLLSIADERDTNRTSNWLKRLRRQFGFSKLWIGASDLAREGQFYWTDGSVYNYTNWVPGEPSATYRGMQQDCVAISGHPFWGQWTDQYCLDRLPFICKIKMCGERTDLAFAIDASGSMGSSDFTKAKRFVKALTSSFKVSYKGAHVGVIRYSTLAKVMFDFNSYFTHDEIKDAIDDIEYTEGGTRTELALKLARTRLFSESGGYRRARDIFKIFILMTDGRSESSRKVAKEAKLLKQRGVHVLAVGIGRSTNQKELESIATSKSDVIGVSSLRELMIRMTEIKDKLCDIAIANERRAKGIE